MTAKLVGRPAGQMFRGDGSLYLKQLFVADTWWTRFRGLQFLPELPRETGLLLESCRSVHTFWMRFPIHVIFLDSQWCVVECRENVAPWRAVLPHQSGVASVLEVSANTDLPMIGEQLTCSSAGSSSGE